MGDISKDSGLSAAFLEAMDKKRSAFEYDDSVFLILRTFFTDGTVVKVVESHIKEKGDKDLFFIFNDGKKEVFITPEEYVRLSHEKYNKELMKYYKHSEDFDSFVRGLRSFYVKAFKLRREGELFNNPLISNNPFISFDYVIDSDKNIEKIVDELIEKTVVFFPKTNYVDSSELLKKINDNSRFAVIREPSGTVHLYAQERSKWDVLYCPALEGNVVIPNSPLLSGFYVNLFDVEDTLEKSTNGELSMIDSDGELFDISKMMQALYRAGLNNKLIYNFGCEDSSDYFELRDECGNEKGEFEGIKLRKGPCLNASLIEKVFKTHSFITTEKPTIEDYKNK